MAGVINQLSSGYMRLSSAALILVRIQMRNVETFSKVYKQYYLKTDRYCSTSGANLSPDNSESQLSQLSCSTSTDAVDQETVHQTVMTRTEVIEKYLHLYDGISEVHTTPSLPAKSFTLASYVNESETLQNLLKMGVDLSRMEKDPEVANYILKLDFEKDVKPYLVFLHQAGVNSDELGTLITKNPDIFREDLDNLQVRINYFKSKKFSSESIARIITVAPDILSVTTKELDVTLGCLQKEFRLTGDEIRCVITRYPLLLTQQRYQMTEMRLHMEDVMGFTKREMKGILLAFPKIFFRSVTQIEERFDYLHNVMQLPHEYIMEWPKILDTRLMKIKPRHMFLKYLNRDQLDPKQPNYVSLKTLVTDTDVNFCQNVAKVPVSEYNSFLKTL